MHHSNVQHLGLATIWAASGHLSQASDCTLFRAGECSEERGKVLPAVDDSFDYLHLLTYVPCILNIVVII